MNAIMVSLLPALVLVTLWKHDILVGAMMENDRMDEYHKRNYTWPIKEFIPNTVGWGKLMNDRFAQVAELGDTLSRYEGYIQTVTPALLSPNFTEFGFGLGRAPKELTEALRKGVREGYENGDAHLEYEIKVIEGSRPLFINRPDLTDRVLREMQEFVEAWSGLELTPYIAYGFRLYQNNSVLNMHVDKPQTHIISIILHIDSSDDAEPWPIFIEDLFGNTHEVILTPGDILFYESSKCLHGRPRQFNGTWYSSVFVHYYPTHGWQDKDHLLEAHYAVPPHWSAEPKTQEYPPLKMTGTGFQEPTCPDKWCRTQDAIKWSGPGEDGYWIAPNMVRHPLIPRSEQGSDEL